jgi:transposase
MGAPHARSLRGQAHLRQVLARGPLLYRAKTRRSYECEHCDYQVYPSAGPPFEKTPTSLHDWFSAMFLFTSTRHGGAR